jgi:hypothetical protein
VRELAKVLKKREIIMRDRFLSTTMAVTITAAFVSAFILAFIISPSAQTQATSSKEAYPALRTPWGDPDLQGIWTDEASTPLERPAIKGKVGSATS